MARDTYDVKMKTKYMYVTHEKRKNDVSITYQFFNELICNITVN